MVREDKQAVEDELKKYIEEGLYVSPATGQLSRMVDLVSYWEVSSLPFLKERDLIILLQGTRKQVVSDCHGRLASASKCHPLQAANVSFRQVKRQIPCVAQRSNLRSSRSADFEVLFPSRTPQLY